MTPAAKPDARTRLLEAAIKVIREKGYADTSVDDLCREAGVTKGAFFHHFASKEALGVAAADAWSANSSALFANAPYHLHDDPLDRLLAYIDFRHDLIAGGIGEFTCLVGTMVQELYEESPAIRDACARSIFGHAQTLEADIALAMQKYAIKADWTPRSLALHTQAVIQGAFILAKAENNPDQARDGITHLRRYIQCLFAHPSSTDSMQ